MAQGGYTVYSTTGKKRGNVWYKKACKYLEMKARRKVVCGIKGNGGTLNSVLCHNGSIY